MHHAAERIVRRQRTVEPADFEELKSMKCEMRLPSFFTGAVANVNVRRLGPAQILGVERPVRIETLAMTQRDACACGSVQSQSHPASDVLAKIINKGAGAD